MISRDDDLKARFARYLNRRQMPRRLDGKSGAMEDEIRALLAVLKRVAPPDVDRLAMWWTAFEAALGMIVQGGLWPTEREIKEAGEQASKEVIRSSSALEPKPDLEIAAQQMLRGEAVAEKHIFEQELIRRGLVDRDTLNRYQRGAYLSRRAVYGEAAAQRWLANMRASEQSAQAEDGTHSFAGGGSQLSV